MAISDWRRRAAAASPAAPGARLPAAARHLCLVDTDSLSKVAHREAAPAAQGAGLARGPARASSLDVPDGARVHCDNHLARHGCLVRRERRGGTDGRV